MVSIELPNVVITTLALVMNPLGSITKLPGVAIEQPKEVNRIVRCSYITA